MKYHARCSTRAQHRKTIKGVYDPNDRVKCHVKGCKGMMRIDVTRENDPVTDRGSEKLCRCDGFEMSLRNAPHRYGCNGCKYHSVEMAKRYQSPRSKHSPISPKEWARDSELYRGVK